MGIFNSFWNWRTARNTSKTARHTKQIAKNTSNATPGMDAHERKQVRSTRKLAKEYRKNGTIH